jgi:hypothetical protein
MLAVARLVENGKNFDSIAVGYYEGDEQDSGAP